MIVGGLGLNEYNIGEGVCVVDVMIERSSVFPKPCLPLSVVLRLSTIDMDGVCAFSRTTCAMRLPLLMVKDSLP